MAQDFNLKGTLYPSFRIGGTNGPILYQGVADPIVTPPSSSIKPGDLYLRINAGSNSGIYSYSGSGTNAGNWTNITANSGSASIGGLAPTVNGFIVGNGAAFEVLEGTASPLGTDARSALGLGTGQSVKFGSYLSGGSSVSMFADISNNTITVGGAAGTLIIPGDLVVNGTSTIVNSGTLEVADKNIIVNVGGSTAGATQSGIIIQGDGSSNVGWFRSALNNANLEFQAPAGQNLTLSIGTASTIALGSATVGQTLRYNGSTFTNKALNLSDLGDVTEVSPALNQSLVYNGSVWSNKTVIDGSGNLNGSGLIIGTTGHAGKQFILYNTTTDATPTNLYLDGSSKLLTIGINTTWLVEVKFSARRTDAAGESDVFWFNGAIDCQASTSTTNMVGTGSIALIKESNAWLFNVSADNVNGALNLSVQGEVGKTIKWTALVTIVETTN